MKYLCLECGRELRSWDWECVGYNGCGAKYIARIKDYYRQKCVCKAPGQKIRCIKNFGQQCFSMQSKPVKQDETAEMSDWFPMFNPSEYYNDPDDSDT